jgi:hypothetical protein
MPFVTYAIWSNISSVVELPVRLHAPLGLIQAGYTPTLPVPPPVPAPHPSSTNQPPQPQAPGAPQPVSRWDYLLGDIPGLLLNQTPQTHWSRFWTTLPGAGATRIFGFAYTANFVAATGGALPYIVTLNFRANLDSNNNLTVTACAANTPTGQAAAQLTMSYQHQHLQGLPGTDEHILTIQIRAR